MKRYVRLSYDISNDSPVYPGTHQVSINAAKEIKRGDSCNTAVIELSSHSGTHVDAPRHFWASGRPISRYLIEELVFKYPLIIECPKFAGEPILAKDLRGCIKKGCEAVLIKTGFSRYRKSNAAKYCTENPYIHPETAEWIREECPSIRALGVDLISISSHVNRDAGRKSHKILLKQGGYAGSPVLLVEDIYFPKELARIDELLIAPLFIDGADSAPCTIIGVVND
jgi:kynurenine formamidase